MVNTLVRGSKPYPTSHTMAQFQDAVAVGLNLSVAGSQRVTYDLNVGRLAVFRYNRIAGKGYQGLSALYVDQDALVQDTLRVLGPVILNNSTTVGPQGVAIIGQLNTTGGIWCEGVLRARNSLVVDGDLLVGAGSGDLVVNRLSMTRSSKVRQDATVDGTAHLVGTITLGSSPHVGVAQNVIPPGNPFTLEIAGVSQFLTGHLGEFSTLKGDWLADGRGSHLTNDLPLRLRVKGQKQGQLLVEAGALAPINISSTVGSLTPLKGGYDSSFESATYGKPMVQVGDAYLESAQVIAQQEWVSGVMTYTDDIVGVSAATIRGKNSQITVGLDLAIGGYHSTKAACGGVSAAGGNCDALQGHIRLYTGLPINSTVVATVGAFERDAYATISGQRVPTVTSPVAVAGSFAFKLDPSALASDTIVSPEAFQVVGNSAFGGFVDIVGSYVNVNTTGATNVEAQSVSVKTKTTVGVDAGANVNGKAAAAASIQAKSLSIVSTKQAKIDAGTNLDIKAGRNLDITAITPTNIDAGGTLNIEGSAQATLNAKFTTISGDALLNMRAPVTTINAAGSMTINSASTKIDSASFNVIGLSSFQGAVTITGLLTTTGCVGCLIRVRRHWQLGYDANGPSDADDERLMVAASDVAMNFELRGDDGSQPGGIDSVYTKFTHIDRPRH